MTSIHHVEDDISLVFTLTKATLAEANLGRYLLGPDCSTNPLGCQAVNMPTRLLFRRLPLRP